MRREQLAPVEVEREAQRLLAVCTEKGVEAVLAEACARLEVLAALADACFRAGLTPAGQYLDYLACPYD
jgi:hypothetical protein